MRTDSVVMTSHAQDETMPAVRNVSQLRGALTRLLCVLAALVVTSASARSQPQPSAAERDSLTRTITQLDSALFDAYNRCDLVKLGNFVTEDLEFYHDQTGLSRGRQSFIDAIRQNICGKVRRDPVLSTFEVHPLNGYGAVETGEHMFCDPRVHRVCTDATSGRAKFVMLWRLQDGKWMIPRVISYDHQSRR
jgi:hypothetical protein